MRISDWSSDVFSSDLLRLARLLSRHRAARPRPARRLAPPLSRARRPSAPDRGRARLYRAGWRGPRGAAARLGAGAAPAPGLVFRRRQILHRPRLVSFPVLAPRFLRADAGARTLRSEEHTSELQSLMRISYAVFCLKK